MQNYNYSARDDYGKVVRGTMMADDETDLSNRISKLGYFLVRARVVSMHHLAKGGSFTRINSKEVLNFTIHIYTMLDSGVPLVAALQDLARDADKENVQKIIDDIRFRVESGLSFKDALCYHPRSFSKLYTAVVGAGESTGKLSSCLKDMASLLDWQLELMAKVKEAATYPLILFFVMFSVVTLLVVKVIPTFEPIFKQAKASLPLPTQIVLAASYVARHYWYLFLGGSVLVIAAYKLYSSTIKGRYILDSLKLKVPLFGSLSRKISLSRFCHTFSLGLKSGVTVLTALDFASDVVGNSRIERAIVKARDAVNVGEKIAGSLQVSGEFPSLVIRMIAVGEQSGSLPHTLDRVSQFYDREIPATIRKVFAFFEPAMIVILGVVVGGIALSIFLPLFQMAQLAGGE